MKALDVFIFFQVKLNIIQIESSLKIELINSPKLKRGYVTREEGDLLDIET